MRVQVILRQSGQLMVRLIGSIVARLSVVAVVAVARVRSHGRQGTVGRRRQETGACRVISVSCGDAVSGRRQTLVVR